MRRLLLVLALQLPALAWAEDGYRLWLRYDRITDEPLRSAYSAGLTRIVLATPAGTESPTLAAARQELTDGLEGLLGSPFTLVVEKNPVAPALGD